MLISRVQAPGMYAGLSEGTRLLFNLAAAGMILWGIGRGLAGGSPTVRRQRRVRFGKTQVRLPREGLVFVGIMLILATGALLGRSNPLLLVFSMMAAPFVINGWLVWSMLNRLRLSRVIPERGMAGTPIAVRLVVANRKWLFSSRLIEVSDLVAQGEDRVEGRVLFVRIPPRDSRHDSWQFIPARRGRYEFGSVRLSSRFPLGFSERARFVYCPGSLIVHPRIGTLSRHWRQILYGREEAMHRTRARMGVFDDEFHRIREFRGGDNPRAIHWRTTARRNELMVREFHESRGDDLVIVLDPWLPRRPEDDDGLRLELAISLAATMCIDHARTTRESRIGLTVMSTDPVSLVGPTTSLVVDAVLDALALTEPTDAISREQLLTRTLDIIAEQRSPCLLITTRYAELQKELSRSGRNGGSQPEEAGKTNLVRLIDASPQAVESYFTLTGPEPGNTPIGPAPEQHFGLPAAGRERPLKT